MPHSLPQLLQKKCLTKTQCFMIKNKQTNEVRSQQVESVSKRFLLCKPGAFRHSVLSQQQKITDTAGTEWK